MEQKSLKLNKMSEPTALSCDKETAERRSPRLKKSSKATVHACDEETIEMRYLRLKKDTEITVHNCDEETSERQSIRLRKKLMLQKICDIMRLKRKKTLVVVVVQKIRQDVPKQM